MVAAPIRYRKLSTRWRSDAKVRRLSKPGPNAETLLLDLIAGEFTCSIPGLLRVGQAALAESRGWPLAGLRAAWAEIEALGLAVADWDARLIWLPNALRHNEPNGPNTVTSWRSAWAELPECPLLGRARIAMQTDLDALGETFGKAFAAACPMPSGMASADPTRAPSAIPSPIQDQDQDQERIARAQDDGVDQDEPTPTTYDPSPPRGSEEEAFGDGANLCAPTRGSHRQPSPAESSAATAAIEHYERALVPKGHPPCRQPGERVDPGLVRRIAEASRMEPARLAIGWWQTYLDDFTADEWCGSTGAHGRSPGTIYQAVKEETIRQVQGRKAARPAPAPAVNPMRAATLAFLAAEAEADKRAVPMPEGMRRTLRAPSREEPCRAHRSQAPPGQVVFALFEDDPDEETSAGQA